MSDRVQMGSLGVVEPESIGESIEYLGRGALAAPLFEARVVVHADTGEHCPLLPAQSLHAPTARVDDAGHVG